LILLGHATRGDHGAKGLLDVLYPLREPEGGNLAVPAYFEERDK
jgi:hypothetical protein